MEESASFTELGENCFLTCSHMLASLGQKIHCRCKTGFDFGDSRLVVRMDYSGNDSGMVQSLCKDLCTIRESIADIAAIVVLLLGTDLVFTTCVP